MLKKLSLLIGIALLSACADPGEDWKPDPARIVQVGDQVIASGLAGCPVPSATSDHPSFVVTSARETLGLRDVLIVTQVWSDVPRACVIAYAPPR